MSNKRIDLTQFEGYIEKLGLREGHHLHIVEEPNRAIGPWNKWEGGLVFDLGETSAHGIYAIPTARLMVAAPRLLAELKRCYEEIDTFYPPSGMDMWGEDPDHPRHEWEEEVVATNVNAGYWHWVSNEKQRLASE